MGSLSRPVVVRSTDPGNGDGGGDPTPSLEQVRLPGRNAGDATLPARRVVVIRSGMLTLADARVAGDADDAFGLLPADVPPGSLARPVVIGPLQDPRWSLTPGALFLGHDGQLVTAAELPADRRFTRQIATAISSDTVLVDPQPAISR